MDEVNFAKILNQQAEMFALCADMEGMKARNIERLANNESLAYPETGMCQLISCRGLYGKIQANILLHKDVLGDSYLHKQEVVS